MLATYYGNWTFWEEYNPSNGTFGSQKVSFDGPNRIIYVAKGVRNINVKEDVYSAWKEWLVGNQESPNATTWPIAISSIGGEALTDQLSVGTTYFLENGWRIKPTEEIPGYVLNVNGNLYTREVGDNPFIPTSGVSVSLTRSNIVDFASLTASAELNETDKLEIAQKVWERAITNPTEGSYGELVKGIDSDGKDIKTRVDKTLTKTEYLSL